MSLQDAPDGLLFHDAAGDPRKMFTESGGSEWLAADAVRRQRLADWLRRHDLTATSRQLAAERRRRYAERRQVSGR